MTNHKHDNSKPGGRMIPDINVRELIEERNWAALIGLSLIGVGLLYALQGLLGFSFNLWSLLMLGLGGWLAYDGWQTYEQQDRAWTDNVRNRLLAGGLLLVIGVMGMIDLNWWGLLLLGVGGWLGYDTWQKVEDTGGVWTEQTRNRMLMAGIVGTFGLFGFLTIGGAWAIILIGIGAFMLYRHFSAGA
ncbi:MAG: hypothetical protein K8S97_04920 [Anaerolineae bacterium]|nr:hypothetical protein [Anaerolineae bacterium]